MRAAVVGLGLMGGSLARALAGRGVEVRGYDPDPAALHAARDEGVLRDVLPASLAGLEDADLLALAVPVSAAVPALEAALPHLSADCVVTDLGSTKRSIVEAAVRLGLGERFVGSHPLTGDHRSGWAASRPELFRGARVLLCPTPRTRPAALESVQRLWSELGAVPEVLDPAAHDRELAWSSHLPQLASSLLARVLATGGIARSRLGPGGRDTTRLAASSPEMWSAICLDNADEILPALEALLGGGEELRAALRERDREALVRLLSAGREWAG